MRKEFFIDMWLYLKEVFQISYRGLWKTTDSKIGNAASLLISGSFVLKYFSPKIESLVKGKEMQEIIEWGLSLLIFAVISWLLRLLFVAPYLAWRRQKNMINVFEINKSESEKQIVRLTQELSEKSENLRGVEKQQLDIQRMNESAEKAIAELKKLEKPTGIPINEAVAYIQKNMKWGSGKTNSQVEEEILRLAIGSTLRIKGMHKWKLRSQVEQYDVDIPVESLKKFRYKSAHGDFGYSALVETLGDDSEERDISLLEELNIPDVYYHPKLNLDEINKHFDREP